MSPSSDFMPELLLQVQQAAPGQAIELLVNAADKHPADARPLVLLAAEFAQAREYDRAEAAYGAALARAPGFAIARFQLGLLQFTSDRPATALSTWSGLDALPADDPLRLFKDAFECMARGERDAACALLQRGMANNTVNAPLNRDMRSLLERLQPPRPSADAGQAGEEPASAHFLVSTYRQAH